MTFDTIVANGTVSTAADTFAADIGIRDGVIVALGRGLSGAERVIDAAGRDVLPGGIDSHVHIAQPSGEGIEMADDFASGTLSALFGGNTTVLPFCMQQRGQSLREALEDYHARADGECYTDLAFHLIISDPSAQVLGQELPAAVADGYTSFKVFMTYEMLRLNDAQILATMDVARRTGALMMVHCENEDAIRYLCDRFAAEDRLEPVSHALTRPQAVEREATHRAITLAEVADVPRLKETFQKGQDIHAMTAADVFEMPLAEVSSEVRRQAKAINFGIIYGISPFGLGRQLQIPQAEAKKFIDKYFNRYPEIRDYMTAMKQRAHEQGYVTTLFGRRCYVPDINSKNPARRQFAERAAMNAPLQGTGADLIKRAMIRLHHRLAGEMPQARLVLSVHDEILIEAPKTQAEDCLSLAKEVMEHAMAPRLSFAIPLLAEGSIGQTWGEAH